MNLFRNFASATVLVLVCTLGLFAQTQEAFSNEANDKSLEKAALLKEYTPLENFLSPGDTGQLITSSTYVFSSLTGVALEDMSSGTTQLLAASLDDNASSVTNIGFDFWYDGTRFT